MRFVLPAVLILAAVSLEAGVFVPPSPRPIFPDDYTVSTCAPATCETFSPDDFRNAAFRFLGLNVDAAWFDKHQGELVELIAPYCRKRNTCLATPGNGHLFCDDLITPGIRSACDAKYPKDKDPHGFEECSAWVETFALGMSQQSLPAWREAQACAKPAAVMHDDEPEVWMAPETIPSDYTGYLTIFALDRNTHIPVFGHIIWDGQIVWAPSNPTGETATYYPFKGPFKLTRVPNGQGHTDVVAPLLTIKYDYYPTMQYRLPVTIPKLAVELKTDPTFKRSGKHTIRVVALDVDTAKLVELQVMLGEQAIGASNTDIPIERRKGQKLPEIWVTSLFDRYNDVVVAPAEK